VIPNAVKDALLREDVRTPVTIYFFNALSFSIVRFN
jgi:hypothetical protein